MDSEQVYAAVSERYSAVSSHSSQLSKGYGKSIAQAFGYSEEELAGIPAESNLGLSCGNPLAIASLQEVVSPFLPCHH
jgi:arsenite methyltransferase